MLVALVQSACSPSIGPLDRLRQSPVRRLESYDFQPDSSVLSRIREAPGFLLSETRAMDSRPDYAPYRPTRADMDLFADCMAYLPKVHREILEKRIVGIFL